MLLFLTPPATTIIPGLERVVTPVSQRISQVLDAFSTAQRRGEVWPVGWDTPFSPLSSAYTLGAGLARCVNSACIFKGGFYAHGYNNHPLPHRITLSRV